MGTDAPDAPDGKPRGDGGEERALDGIELQVVEDQDLRSLEPASFVQVLAGGAEQRRVVGEPALDAVMRRWFVVIQ